MNKLLATLLLVSFLAGCASYSHEIHSEGELVSKTTTNSMFRDIDAASISISDKGAVNGEAEGMQGNTLFFEYLQWLSTRGQ